ncbi:MAG: ribose 5-phosphate isomerase B [Myxococcota bacterium]
MSSRRIAIGSDHAGFKLKEELEAALIARGYDVEDLGTHDAESTDYPDYAHPVARAVAQDDVQLGILVCGTGIGMAMAANRHPGVRAAVVSEPFSARMARAHNDANVLCIGARVVGAGLALDILEAFLQTPFEGGRHQRRVDKLDEER